MALGIALKSTTETRPVTSFEDDGYYWHLVPTYEAVSKLTGKFIDLYDAINFAQSDLPILLRFLEQAKLEAAQKEEEWDVIVGRDGFTGELLFGRVTRRILMEKLEPFIRSVKEAIEMNGSILCIGD